MRDQWEMHMTSLDLQAVLAAARFLFSLSFLLGVILM